MCRKKKIEKNFVKRSFRMIQLNMKKLKQTQIEQYGPYTAAYSYFTMHEQTVYGRNIGHRNTVLS